MGVVYQARRNLTGRLVALKLIMPETATTRTAIDRFYREMLVIGRISQHPNVVVQQGMTRGQFWFAMEYVAGSTARPCLAGTGDVCVSGLEKSSLCIKFMSGVWT